MKTNFLKNGASLLSTKQTTILSAATIIMINVAASRALGLLRDRLLATYFGSSSSLGVYFAAFRLPDMIFQLLVMGALSTAFIPVLTSLLSQGKKKMVWQVSSIILNIGLVLFAILALLVFIFAPTLSRLIAPGFNQEELILMARLTRIMLISQFFFILSNFLTGILQSFKRFLIPAVAPVLYNLGIILGIVFLAPKMGIYGPTIGVILGTLLHFGVQLPLARRLGLKHSFSLNWRNPHVKEIGRLMLPRTIGLAVAQVDLTVDIILASLISTSSLVFFSFAQRLQVLPVGLFGAAIAQAALPTLSEQGKKKDITSFKKTFLLSFHQILFLVFPASVLLIILRIPLVRIVFGAARFDWEATILTGQVLSCFSISLFAQALVHLLARAFYALHDSKTPVIIGAASVITNVLLSSYFILVLKLPIWGLGLSTSMASILHALILLFFLDKKVGIFKRAELMIPAAKIFLASFITGFALYFPLKLLDKFIFDTTRVSGLIVLTGVVSLFGFLFYLTLAWALKIKTLKSFMRLLEKLEMIQKTLRGQSLEPVEVIDGSTELHP